MTDRQNGMGILYPLGVMPVDDGVKILAQAAGETCRLLLYRRGEKTPCETIAFSADERLGDVWSMTLSGRDLENLEYCLEVDGKIKVDEYARAITGHEKWADFKACNKPVRGRFVTEDFDWEGDRPLKIPFNETIIYRLHVRGFTKHASSDVPDRGTFSAVEKKIPYMKELGITAVELMPMTEFNEVMMPEEIEGNPYGKTEPTGVINYWGYGPSCLFAPKAAYSRGPEHNPVQEFKHLVKSLHKNGLECIIELYFTGSEPPRMAADVLRYWVQEYHVDGFKLSGFAPAAVLAKDAFLSRTKLFYDYWEDSLTCLGKRGHDYANDDPADMSRKHLAEYNDQFQNDMRQLLKGDEDKMNALVLRNKRNPAEYGVINYMANTNGFTMMDMVSYDQKHNEKNGENGRDGSARNYSWNCGVEGPSRKKKIVQLRKRQLRNAFLLLFLSQGTPLLLAGDEFGNSQNGNNNAYCQDNEISWLNWKQLTANADLYEFVKYAIHFRKEHPLFHMEREPRLMDYHSCGRPDVSYHGENAWKPEFENFRRQLGILYWGPYGTRKNGEPDETFYVAVNMHWEPHVFGMPHLSKGQMWHVAFDTSAERVNGFYPEGREPMIEDQSQSVIPPRSILVFVGKDSQSYFVYNTPIGELTVSCNEGSVTGVRFGRTLPEDPSVREMKTELSERVFTQLMEYFDGNRKTFDLPLAPVGTEFQKKVWKALRNIPYGETRSYKQIAAAVGDEKACRAVGMANNKNPIAIITPCHRVVGADGTMVGYAGGLEIKKRLLELEQAADRIEQAR